MNSHRKYLKTLASRRGVSLLELILGLALVSIFLGVTVVTLRSSIEQEGPKALAYTLASDLKAARAEAKRSGKLVAFCLPSDNKTNPFSKNALVRKGEQRGHILRLLNYGGEYNGAIFTGTWGTATTESHPLTAGWQDSIAQELAIFFRPDGTAFSPDVPSLDGNYPLVVGSAFSRSGNTLSAISNPSTIWVSRAGTVTLNEKSVPVGNLPPGGGEPTIAGLDYLSSEPSPTSPVIQDIKFLPEKVVGLDSVGMGQNYVNVHPDQKESERLEYGIATMLVKATDSDGGPLYYELEAFSSSGNAGRFSVSNESGPMAYVYDEDERRYYWQSLISWRPPPGAGEDTVYELEVTVKDEDGNTDTTSSGAGLIPKISTLTPTRMVLASTDGRLFLTNIEGGSTVEITDAAQPETGPFFSADGSRVYSFYRPPSGGEHLRVRTADGSRNFRTVRQFNGSVQSSLKYDPTYTYVAYVDPGSTQTFEYPHKKEVRRRFGRTWRWVLEDQPPTRENGSRLEVLHLYADNPPITITNRLNGRYFWDANGQYQLFYSDHNALSPVRAVNVPSNPTYIPPPGVKYNPTQWVRLDGYPPAKIPVSGTEEDSSNGSFNPADERWYVIKDGSRLLLKDRTNASWSKRLHNGNLVGKASWSSNGEQLAFVSENGSNREVHVLEVMEGNPLRPKASPTTRFEHRDNGLRDAQLAPTGKYVFFLKGSEVFRAVNASGASPVSISRNLGRAIDTYVVSP